MKLQQTQTLATEEVMKLQQEQEQEQERETKRNNRDVSWFNLPEKGVENPRTSDHLGFIQEREFRYSVHDPLVAASSSRRQKPDLKGSHVVAVHDPLAAGSYSLGQPKLKGPDHHHVVAGHDPLVVGSYFRRQPELHHHVVVAHDPLVVGSSYRSQEPVRKGSDHHDVVAAHKIKGTSRLRNEPETETKPLTPREKVIDVLRHYVRVYKRLERRHLRDSSDTTYRLSIETQKVLVNMGKVVNKEKQIGSISGIKVGDEFRFKTQLAVVGLHFRPMAGIDYTTIRGTKFATCIVISEGCGYHDKFDADVVVYTGEGGNLIHKDKKTEDQKLVKGNLALANSHRERREVRVIRGEARRGSKVRSYVYKGLYIVDEFWQEVGASGKDVFRFKLSRIR